MNEYTVYMHITPNNKYYIGITKQSIQKRWKYSYGYKSQTLFWRAIQKYGWENIKHIVIAENLSHDDACKKEIELIAKYQSNNPKYGYNRTSGGDGTCNFSHKNPHSEEWKRKISIANTGKKRTDEAKQKMRNAKLGTHWSEERKENYSKSQKLKGARPTDECIKASNEARRISICVYDKEQNLIGKFNSLTEAAKELNISVSYVSLLLAGNKHSQLYNIQKEDK